MNNSITTYACCEDQKGIIFHCLTNNGILTTEDPKTGLQVAVVKLESFTEEGAEMIDYIRTVVFPEILKTRRAGREQKH